MEDTKPWYLSTGVWGAVAVVMTAVATKMGWQVDLAGVDNDVIMMLTGVMALYGRWSAKQKIG